jgi:GH25 family lysozyme M1 (1,4-beta-N-acetylmuramidase)
VTIFGWDASHYDWDRGPMDIAAAVRDGIAFMTHKATEGTTLRDNRYDDFAGRARGVVPLTGAYSVNHRGDQRPQVDYFLRYLDEVSPWWRDGPFIVQLDAERWSYAAEPTPTEVRAWCDYFVQRTGGRWQPIVYGPRWVYGDTLRGLPYRLWQSDYGSDPAVHYRTAYPGDGSSRWAAYSGQIPTILQYGSRTRIGSQNTCDANAFRGTLDQLRALVYPQGADMQQTEPLAYPTSVPGRTVGQVLADLQNLRDWLVGPPGAASVAPPGADARVALVVDHAAQPQVDPQAVADALAANPAFVTALADALASRLSPGIARAVVDEEARRLAS